MKLYDLVIELRFKDKVPFIGRDIRYELLEAVGGKKPDADDNQVRTVEIRRKDKKIKVVAQENRYAISSIANNAINTLKITQRQIRDIYKIVDYTNLETSRIGVKTVWVEEVESGYEELVELFKTTFYKSGIGLIDGSKDVSINLTLDDEGLPVNYLVGPVGPEESRNYISFPTEIKSPASIMVIVDRYSNEQSKMHTDDIYEFMEESVKYASNLSIDTSKLILGQEK